MPLLFTLLPPRPASSRRYPRGTYHERQNRPRLSQVCMDDLRIERLLMVLLSHRLGIVLLCSIRNSNI